MSLMESPNERCMSCRQISFCMVLWGTDCKRQGGNRIPRIKSIPTEKRRDIKLISTEHRRKPDETFHPVPSEKYNKMRNQVPKMFEQIYTKVMKW